MLFVVIARDGKDKDALNRRMASREAHLEGFRAGLASQQNLIGGALLNNEGAMQGSMMVVDFTDRAALDQWLKNDPYITGNVWQDIEVIPFKLAGKI